MGLYYTLTIIYYCVLYMYLFYINVINLDFSASRLTMEMPWQIILKFELTLSRTIYLLRARLFGSKCLLGVPNVTVYNNHFFYRKANDLTLVLGIREELSTEGLYLYLIPDDAVADQVVNKEQLLTILIIVISVLLGTICIVLIIAFLMRTKSLNRQLKAFSMTDTDFGSVSSDLNRRNAPTTNVFSVEGSNPVLHNNMMRKSIFDEESIQSDDSDIIGFDDHPNDYNKKSLTNGDVHKRV